MNVLTKTYKKRLIFIGIASYLNIAINCQELKPQPDITLLSRVVNNEYKYTCVIGNNTSENGVVFITPLSITYLPIASEFRTLDGIPISEELNCDFENECSKIFKNNDWDTVLSENLLLSIINDIRFEKLYTYKTRNTQIPFEISERDFYFPISVRAEEEPQILVCTDGNENEDIIQCYWIRIEKSGDNFYEVVIRNCSEVNRKIFSITDSVCILLDSAEHKTNLIRDLDWFHFIVLRNENKLIFKDAVLNIEYIKLGELKYDLKKIYVLTSNGKRGEWKMHKNSYLQLKTFESDVQLGPIFTSNNKNKFCISMLASICQGCSLEIQINNQQKQYFRATTEIWQNIKLISDNIQQNEFKIFVKGTRKNNADIIAIDNIRMCNENEIRILSINNQFKIPNIACKALKYPTWYSSLDYIQRSSSGVCSDAKYIGMNCDIPCSTVLGQGSETEFCNKHIICKSQENIHEKDCVCAAGYRGTYCNEICKPNYFGYNCQKRCGQCKNNETCLKSSGNCLQGCDPDYVPDTCIFKRYQPVNLNGTSDEKGQIQLYWHYPKTNDSIFNFHMMVSLMKTENANKFFKREENVTFSGRKEEYTYTLEKLVPLSSTYSVEVAGNGKMDHSAKTTIVTPPVQPMLTGYYITGEDNYDNSKKITIPGIIPETKCKISYMYVTVCNETDTIKQEIKYPNDTIILSHITCSGISWIAAKMKTNENEVTFTVGNGNKTLYNNPPLEGYNNYNICVVLTNEYEQKTAFNVYCEDNEYDSNTNWIVGISVLGVLGLGIIIFSIVSCVLCCKQRKENRNWGREEQTIAELNPLNRNVSETEERPQAHATDL